MSKKDNAATKEAPPKIEAPEAQKRGMSLDDLGNRAERFKDNPKATATLLIHEMKGNESPEKQADHLIALNLAVVNILSKLSKKGVDIKRDWTATDLKREVMKNAISLDVDEGAALENLDRILHETGPTSKEITDSWQDRVKAAQEASKGLTGTLGKYWKKDPVGTTAVLAAGAAGIFLGYQALKAWFSDGNTDKKSLLKKTIGAMIVLATGAYLGKDVLKSLADIGVDGADVACRVQSGTALTPDQQKRIAAAAPQLAGAIEDARKKAGVAVDAAGAAVAAAGAGNQVGGADTPTQPPAEPASKVAEKKPEAVGDDLTEKSARYTALYQGVIAIYCIDDKKFPEATKGKIRYSFELMRKVPVEKILAAYNSSKDGDKKVSFKELGIIENKDTDDAALFHTCAITSRVFEETKKIDPVAADSKKTLEDFFSHLGSDPATKMSMDIQTGIASKIKEIGISGLLHPQESAEKIFSGEMINETIEKNKDKFALHLANHYGISLEGFDKKESADFLYMVGTMYGGNYTLDQSEATLDTFLSSRSADEKVKDAAKKFVIKLKTEVLGTSGLLKKCIERYDIKRPDNKDYDEVLKRYMKPELIHFKDGFKMALLSDGIQFDQKSEHESVGQAKDITMLCLMVSILKDRSPNEGYPHYLGNLAEFARGKVKIPNIELIQPYLYTVFTFVCEEAKASAERIATETLAVSDTNRKSDKIEIVDKEGWVEFGLDSTVSGARGALQMPVDLVNIIRGKFPDSFDEETTGEDTLKMVLSLGGCVTYVPGGSQATGLVYLYGKYFFIKPLAIPIDTLHALFTKGFGTAAKTYVLGASSYVVFGATLGAIEGGMTHAGTLKGAIKGGLKGLAAPYYAPKTGLRGLIRGREAAYDLQYYRYKNISTSVRNIEESAALFKKYRTLTYSESSGTLQKGAAWLEKPMDQASKFLFNDIYKKALEKWAHRFSINYNDFWGVNPEVKGNEVAGGLRSIDLKDPAFYNGEEFLKKVERMEEVLAKIKKLKGLETMKETSFFETLKDVLHSEEITTLSAKSKRLGFDEFRTKFIKDLTTKPRIRDDLSHLKSKVKDRFSKKSPDKTPDPADTADTATPKDPAKSAETAEAASRSAKTEAAIKQAEKDLAEVSKRMKPAEDEIKTIGALKERPTGIMGEAGAIQKRLESAQKIVEEGEKAKAKLNESIKALQGLKEASAKLPNAETITKLTTELEAAEKAAQEAADESVRLFNLGQPTKEAAERSIQARNALREAREALSQATKAKSEFETATQAAEKIGAEAGVAAKGISKLGKLGTVAKMAGRGLGILGVGVGAYQAGASAYEAATTDVEGRAGVKGAEAAVWATSATVDAAAVAVMFGKGGAIAGRLSNFALPLVPITIAANTMLETKYEDTKKDYEWIQDSPQQALNNFYTSINSVSLGDAWLTGMHVDSGQERVDSKAETMHRIFKGLVAIQKDPSLLNFITSEPPSKQKDKEIEKRIGDSYSAYHEFYFRCATPSLLANYQDAQKFILDAQMFDEIMQKRDAAKMKGEEFVITGKDKAHPFSLHLSRYDVTGGIDSPQGRTPYIPSQVVAAYKESVMGEFESDPTLKTNMERMDSTYLIRLYVQAKLVLDEMKGETKGDALKIGMANLDAYLKVNRGVNIALASRQPEYHKPLMKFDQIKEHLESMGSEDNKSFLDFEKDHLPQTPALHSLYKLGEYFGYVGEPSETDLKNFFVKKSSTDHHGIYWDPSNSEWKLNEHDHLLSDHTLGKELNTNTIQSAIALMRKDPESVLRHRSDTLFLNAHDFTDEVKLMAKILEEGLAEGKKRGYSEKLSETPMKAAA